MNWAVAAKLSDGSTPPPRREDWSRPGRLEEVLPHVDGVFRLPMVDPLDIIRATPEFYEYPMCDRDPLPRWSLRRGSSDVSRGVEWRESGDSRCNVSRTTIARAAPRG